MGIIKALRSVYILIYGKLPRGIKSKYMSEEVRFLLRGDLGIIEWGISRLQEVNKAIYSSSPSNLLTGDGIFS